MMKTTKRHISNWVRGAAFVAAMTLVLSFGAGCIFDTRPAYPPKTEVPKVPLVDPQNVFTSMKLGLEGDAMSSYQRALSDLTFFFSPLLDDSLDQTFSQNNPSVYNNWTKDVEVEVTNLLLSEYDSLTVTFKPSFLINENTFVRYKTEYSIRVVDKVSRQATIYKGIAHIDVHREGGVWQIQYWKDAEPIEPDKYHTWGFLRGILRQRLLS